MKKIFLFVILIITASIVVSCSKGDDDNRVNNYLIGKWKAENVVYSSFKGGTWYSVMDFQSNGSFSSYYEKSDGTVEMKIENNKYVITSDSTFTTYKSDMSKIGDYIYYNNNFKPSTWNDKGTIYYLTFWKQ